MTESRTRVNKAPGPTLRRFQQVKTEPNTQSVSDRPTRRQSALSAQSASQHDLKRLIALSLSQQKFPSAATTKPDAKTESGAAMKQSPSPIPRQAAEAAQHTGR